MSLTGVIDDRYAIERELGRGGIATVYLARDIRLQHPNILPVLDSGKVDGLPYYLMGRIAAGE